ncbi:MAG: nucleotidyltransferase family protein [Rhodospirillales bacterium]
MSDVEAVILAAGRGSRMGKVGELHPKALLPIANRPAITHHFDLLRRLGIGRVFVVVGHRSDLLVAAVERMPLDDLRVTFVDQGDARGSAHALGRLRDRIGGAFVVLLGDYLFDCADPSRMLARLRDGSAGAIACKEETDRDMIRQACLVEAAEDGRVRTIVEKPVAPHGRLKGCGFYAFQPEIFDAVARTPRTALRDEYELTVAIEIYLGMGRPFHAEPIIAWDANLTRPDDLLDCNLRWLSRLGADNLVAETASLQGRLSLRRTVVGAGAHLSGEGRLDQVLVFPDSASTVTDDVSRTIFIGDCRVSCAGGRE